MKYIIVLITILFIWIAPLHAQYCDMPDTVTAELKSGGAGCDNYINYAPYPISPHTSTKKVRVAFHVFQDSSGNGNFKNISEHKNYLNNLIDSVNGRFSHIKPVSSGSSPHVPDAKIRIALHDIYYYQNQTV